MRFSNTVAFFAVAAIPVNVHAMNGNFSEKFEDALKNEFGARVFKGLEDRHCDTVTCALTIGKATPCLMKLAMDDNIGDVPKCLNLCPCFDCLAKEIKSFLKDYSTCAEGRLGSDGLFARVYLDLASDDEKTRARTWGFTPPPITDDL
ncbi:hypothetical protein AB1N83_010048 [Pleurotus pulmonarius]